MYILFIHKLIVRNNALIGISTARKYICLFIYNISKEIEQKTKEFDMAITQSKKLHTIWALKNLPTS